MAAAKQPYNKQPQTYKDQVQLLEQRGLNILDSETAEFYLSQLNYYRFIGYCLPFEADHATHQFKQGVYFEDILNLYIFDRELRLHVLDAIERIEVALRSQLAYHLSHNHNTAHPQLDSNLFKNLHIYAQSKQKLNNEIKNSREDFIQHLTQKYAEAQPPIWAVVELMTMGQLSKWFSNIRNRQDRKDISASFGLNESVMTSLCEHISLVRNISAHHSRLWNRDFLKKPKLPKNCDNTLTSSLLYLDSNDRLLKKLYNTLVLLAYLMEQVCQHSTWMVKLKSLISEHNIDVTKMGFPNNWMNKPIWQTKKTNPMDKIITIDGEDAVISYDADIKLYRGEFLNQFADFYAPNMYLLKREGEKSLRTLREVQAEKRRL
jgi:abortive infection bacteriophage resistance protein